MDLSINKSECAIVLLGLMLALGTGNVDAAWVNATGTLAGIPTECGEVQGMWAVPNTNKVIVGVSANGLWATSNGGTNWSKMGGTSGNAMTLRSTQMVFDPVNPDTWWVGGIYHSPGVFKTTDAGVTWTACGNTYHHDGISVDFSDPQRKLILAGGHEANQTLYKSTDGGTTWTNIGSSLPGGGFTSNPYIIDTQRWLMGIGNGVGIYLTVNGGGSWTKVCSTSPGSCINKASSGELYCSGGGKVLKGSSDGTTWTTLTASAYGGAPIEIPGGKIVTISGSGISISADKGSTWKTFASPMPAAIAGAWNINSLTGWAYNSVAGAFYIFHWNCSFTNPVVMSADEVWRYDTLIGGGTAVEIPHKATFVQAALAKDAGVFDVSGRVIDRNAFGFPARRNAVYFVRESDGRISRTIGISR